MQFTSFTRVFALAFLCVAGVVDATAPSLVAYPPTISSHNVWCVKALVLDNPSQVFARVLLDSAQLDNDPTPIAIHNHNGAFSDEPAFVHYCRPVDGMAWDTVELYTTTDYTPLVFHVASTPDGSMSASVSRVSQYCNALEVDLTLHNVSDDTMVWTIASIGGHSVQRVWDSRSVADRWVLPRSVSNWHLQTQWVVIFNDEYTVLYIDGAHEQCNHTYYYDYLSSIRDGADPVRVFQFSWDHATPSFAATVWSLLIGVYQAGILTGTFQRHIHTFVLFTAVILSIHVPLMLHLTFTVYTLYTLCGFTVPIVVYCAMMTYDSCAGTTMYTWKLPDPSAFNRLLQALVFVVLQSVFVIVALVNDGD